MANALLATIERQHLRRERVFRDRQNPLETLQEDEVVRRYRLNRDSSFYLTDILNNQLERPKVRNYAIPPIIQVLTALSFYSTGTFQSVVGDLHGISKASASRVIRHVSHAIANINVYPLCIKFPSSPREIADTQQAFYSIAMFPNVVGCVDGTQIAIKAPSVDEHVYVCRKNFHSLNVQASTDAKFRFTSVVAKYPRSTHDSFVLRQSGLWAMYERGDMAGTIILGDSGYPLKPWLMVPYIDPCNGPQARFNKSLKITRCSVERAFGVAKSRFRCIHHKSGGCLMYSPDISARIIVAVFKLHNLCINNNLPLPEIEPDISTDEDSVYLEYHTAGNRAQDELVRLRFSEQ